MKFAYVAYTRSEGIVHGTVEASSDNAARTEIGLRGYTPLRIQGPRHFAEALRAS